MHNDRADAVSELLQRGFDPNTRDPKGQPALMVAMREHALAAAKVLLAQPQTDRRRAQRGRRDAADDGGAEGRARRLPLLLARGAAVNRDGWSPLHYAATGPNPKVVELLLDRGAAVNAASPNGTTPLMMAARYGSEDGLRLLLKRGADWKRRNERGLAAADFAHLAGRDGLAAQLRDLPH